MISDDKRIELDQLPLRQLINETGMTQIFFAQKLGVSKQAIHQVITGRDTSKRLSRAIREHCYRMYL